nr:MAG TPA: hypothetical protein [Caudoviricetes sp.]
MTFSEVLSIIIIKIILTPHILEALRSYAGSLCRKCQAFLFWLYARELCLQNIFWMLEDCKLWQNF